MSVKLLVVVVIVFMCYPSTYYLMHGSLKFEKNKLKIRITTFKQNTGTSIFRMS